MVPRDVMGNMSINIDGEFYAIIVGRLATVAVCLHFLYS